MSFICNCVVLFFLFVFFFFFLIIFFFFCFYDYIFFFFFFFSSRRRHTRFDCDWSSDVCSSDLSFRSISRTQEIVIGVPAYRRTSDQKFGRLLLLPFTKQRDYWNASKVG